MAKFDFRPYTMKNFHISEYVGGNDSSSDFHLVEWHRKIPFLIVNEYEINPNGNISAGIKTLINTLGPGLASTSPAYNAVKAGIKKWEAATGAPPDSGALENVTGADTMLKYIEKMISLKNNKPVNEYALPALNLGTFIQVDGSQGWSAISASKAIGSSVSNYVDFVQNSLQLDTPVTMTWNLKDPTTESKAPDLSIKFYLYNYNTTSAIDNLKFIRSIASGPMWHWESFTKNPPNLYKVWYPGCLGHVWSTLVVKIDGIPPFRKPSKSMIGRLSGQSSTFQYKQANDFMLPDTFSVELTFKPMFPYNRNTALRGYGIL